jgi:hypothetical protein
LLLLLAQSALKGAKLIIPSTSEPLDLIFRYLFVVDVVFKPAKRTEPRGDAFDRVIPQLLNIRIGCGSILTRGCLRLRRLLKTALY